MPSSKEILCDQCKFPMKRGRLPIIWPSDKLGRRPYCSVRCLENAMGGEIPEPHRSKMLAGEGE